MLRRIVYSISDAGRWIGGFALVALMLVTVGGVLFRIARISTIGFYETITVVGLFVFVCALAYAQTQKVHLRVFIFVSRLPQRAQLVIDTTVHFLSVGACSLMVWYSIVLANSLLRSGKMVSIIFPMPVFPLMYIAALFIMMLDLVLIIGLIDSLAKALGRR